MVYTDTGEPVMQQSAGVCRWNSLEEVFSAWNSAVNYVIVQNNDSSIDILTDDRKKLIRMLQPSGWRFFRLHQQIKTNIGGRQILWNVRNTGDGYFCLQWEQDMLKEKVLNSKNVYVLNEEHHFYSFVYSSLLHKKWLTNDHYATAHRLLESLPQTGEMQITANGKDSFPDAFDYYFDLLNNYMQRKEYVFCRPHRAWYNQVLASTIQIAHRLEKDFKLSHVKPIRVSSSIRKKGLMVKLEHCLTFYQAWLNGKKIFIKHGGYEGTHEPEFRFCNRLHQINQNNFPESPFYADDKHSRCVAYDFIEGELLEKKIKNEDFSPSEKEKVIVQLKKIANSFLESGIVHRDLLPKNFIVSNEGQLKLFDFEFAVDSRQYKEFRAVQKNPLYFYVFFEKDRCDAVFPLLDVLERIGCHESYQETYRDVESFLREHSGKVFIKFKYQHLYYLQLAYNAVKKMLKHLKR